MKLLALQALFFARPDFSEKIPGVDKLEIAGGRKRRVSVSPPVRGLGRRPKVGGTRTYVQPKQAVIG